MGTIIVGILVAGFVGLAGWSLYHNKKRGKCCGGCGCCKSGCPYGESSAGGDGTPPNFS